MFRTLVFYLFLLVDASIIAALTSQLASHKDYIDLLRLESNDEFQWGWRENYQNDNHLDGSKYGSSLPHHNASLMHRLIKRQAAISQNPFLINRSFGDCDLPSGERGDCRQMIYCRLPELYNNTWLLLSHLCVIEQKSIGICCPKNYRTTGPEIVVETKDSLPPEVNQPEQRGCGMTTKQYPKITASRLAEPDEWPWMAALIRKGQDFVWCGGSLITDRLVLTAAHCIHNRNMSEFMIRLGEYNIRIQNETRSRDFTVANWVIHLDYNPYTNENDIALIRLSRPTLFNTYIWPVCMPPLNEDWTERMAIITGWGTQLFGGPRAQILMEVTVPVWRNEDCKKAIVERIADTMLCAGYPEGGHDACQGDSGGPLLVQLPNRRWVQIGIVSWGAYCGLPMSPGVYTRLNKYLNWVVENSDI